MVRGELEYPRERHMGLQVSVYKPIKMPATSSLNPRLIHGEQAHNADLRHLWLKQSLQIACRTWNLMIHP